MALPAQTKYIVGNEACERFSFYGMRSILVAYMTGMLLMSKNEATEVVHLFIACTYLMPLLGAWVADRILGSERVLFFSGGLIPIFLNIRDLGLLQQYLNGWDVKLGKK